jgi:hypothetical protein
MSGRSVRPWLLPTVLALAAIAATLLGWQVAGFAILALAFGWLIVATRRNHRPQRRYPPSTPNRRRRSAPNAIGAARSPP